jgi:hypothetical protein
MSLNDIETEKDFIKYIQKEDLTNNLFVCNFSIKNANMINNLKKIINISYFHILNKFSNAFSYS